MKERRRFEEEITELGLESPLARDALLSETGAVAGTCPPECDAERQPKESLPAVGFEFDLNYGALKVEPPFPPDLRNRTFLATIDALNLQNISTFREDKEGFRLAGDGPRIEIATKPFQLSSVGQKEMMEVMNRINELVSEIQKECDAVSSKPSVSPPVARHFKPKWLTGSAKNIYPMRLTGQEPFYSFNCRVASSPQATIEIPLSRINELVTKIHDSEGYNTPGKTLSGPKFFEPGKRWRQGVHSQALYDAQKMVNARRDHHIKKRKKLPNGKTVTTVNFSSTLQGLLILMVSYLRTSEIEYSSRDNEPFAKSVPSS